MFTASTVQCQLVCFSRVLFSDHVNSRLVKWHQWRAPKLQCGPDIAPTVSIRLSSLVVEYWPIVGECGCYSYSRLYHYVILLLCFSLCHHPPPSIPRLFPPAHPHIHWPNINELHEKSSKTSENQPLFTCQVPLAVKMLIDV